MIRNGSVSPEGEGAEKGRGIEKSASRRRTLILAMALLTSLSLAAIIGTLAFNAFFRPFYVAVALFSLSVSLIAVTGHLAAAIRTMEAGFAAILFSSIFFSENSAHGALLSFLPAFSLLCLYFDGSRTLPATTLFSAATCVGWYAYVGHRSLGPGPALTYFVLLAYIQMLVYLVDSDLRYAVLDIESLLRELNHRVRNLLAIIRALAADSALRGARRGETGEGAGERERILSLQVDSLRAIEEALSPSSDYRCVPMAGPLSKLVTAARLSWGTETVVRTDATLPFDKAVKVALLLSEILFAESLREGPRRLALRLRAEGERGFLELEALDGARWKAEAWGVRDEHAGMLLSQLSSRVVPAEDGLSLAIDFDAREGPSAMGEEDEALRFADRFHRDTWHPLLGKRNLGKSRSHIKKCRTLVTFLGLESILMAILTVYTFAASHTIRTASLLMLGLSALTFAAVRLGSPRAGAALFAVAGNLTALLAMFTGSDSGRGVQLITVQLFFLFALHFLGRASGILVAVWGCAAYAAWFLFHPAKQLPTTAFQTFCISLSFFYAVSMLIVRDLGRDVRLGETLVLHFKRGIDRSVGLLAPLPGESAAEHYRRLERQVLLISIVHSAVTAKSAGKDLEPDSVIREFIGELGGGAGIRVQVSATGTLPAETAHFLLLAIGELWTDPACRAGSDGSMALTLTRSGRDLVFAARYGASVNGPSAARIPDSPFLRLIEDRLAARRLEGSPNEYRLLIRA